MNKISKPVIKHGALFIYGEVFPLIIDFINELTGKKIYINDSSSVANSQIIAYCTHEDVDCKLEAYQPTNDLSATFIRIKIFRNGKFQTWPTGNDKKTMWTILVNLLTVALSLWEGITNEPAL